MANEPDRRSVLAEAFEKAEKVDEAGAAGGAGDGDGAGAPEEPLEQLDAGDGGQADDGAPLGAEVDGEEEAAAAQKARDEKGRFAKEKAAKAAKAAAGKKAGAKADAGQADDAGAAGEAGEGQGDEAEKPAAAAATTEKPPASWKPAARETWAKLPAEARSEISRREKETSVALQKAAESTRSAEYSNKAIGAVSAVLAPFEPHIRASQAARGEQYNPLKVIDGLLRTAHVLETGPAPEKAKLMVGLMRQYGVTVDQMNPLLGDEPAPGQQPGQGQQPPAYRDPRVDELEARERRREQETADQRVQHKQRLEQESQRELDTFAQSHEFFEDVRGDMSIAMARATDAGQTLTLEQAYQKAIRMNDDVRPIFEQREAAKKAKARQAASLKARAAGTSLRSTPAARPPSADGAQLDDRRSLIESVWDEKQNDRL